MRCMLRVIEVGWDERVYCSGPKRLCRRLYRGPEQGTPCTDSMTERTTPRRAAKTGHTQTYRPARWRTSRRGRGFGRRGGRISQTRGGGSIASATGAVAEGGETLDGIVLEPECRRGRRLTLEMKLGCDAYVVTVLAGHGCRRRTDVDRSSSYVRRHRAVIRKKHRPMV